MNDLYSSTPAQLVAMCSAPKTYMAEPLKGYSVIQPKYDGWFITLKCVEGKVEYVTRGAEVRHTATIDSSFNFILVGEWMYGTNWSQSHSAGRVYLHDVLIWNEDDLRKVPYWNRYENLEEFVQKLKPVLNVDIMESYFLEEDESFAEKVKAIWYKFVSTQGFEGLVFKQRNGLFGSLMGRKKNTFTIDYVCMSAVEGSGRISGKLGALIGGLWENGKLVARCSVGGGYSDGQREEYWAKKDELIGKVFEAYGNQVFSGGSLRHPNFLRWREDKPADECVWPLKK